MELSPLTTYAIGSHVSPEIDLADDPLRTDRVAVCAKAG